MQNKSFLILILLMVSSIFLSAEELTFRGIPFGSTFEEVEAKEGEGQKSSGQSMGDFFIQYNKIKVAGYNADMQMEFKENALIAGVYQFNIEQKELLSGIDNPKNFVNAYTDLSNKLSKLYGIPHDQVSMESMETSPSAYVADKLTYDAPYITTWEAEGGAVMLMLTYKDKWNLILVYSDQELYEKMVGKKDSTEGL